MKACTNSAFPHPSFFPGGMCILRNKAEQLLNTINVTLSGLVFTLLCFILHFVWNDLYHKNTIYLTGFFYFSPSFLGADNIQVDTVLFHCLYLMTSFSQPLSLWLVHITQPQEQQSGLWPYDWLQLLDTKWKLFSQLQLVIKAQQVTF